MLKKRNNLFIQKKVTVEWDKSRHRQQMEPLYNKNYDVKKRMTGFLISVICTEYKRFDIYLV